MSFQVWHLALYKYNKEYFADKSACYIMTIVSQVNSFLFSLLWITDPYDNSTKPMAYHYSKFIHLAYTTRMLQPIEIQDTINTQK